VEVGSLPANPFGLHEVHGNVWEWVEDGCHEDYEGAPKDGSVWTQGADNSKRVLRGGSWNNFPRLVRAASRVWCLMGIRSNNHGFRVARTLP